LVEEKNERVAEQLQRAATSDAANIDRSGVGQQQGGGCVWMRNEDVLCMCA
jgi:hypothetical protein